MLVALALPPDFICPIVMAYRFVTAEIIESVTLRVISAPMIPKVDSRPSIASIDFENLLKSIAFRLF